jgi:hypothetical protein
VDYGFFVMVSVEFGMLIYIFYLYLIMKFCFAIQIFYFVQNPTLKGVL